MQQDRSQGWEREGAMCYLAFAVTEKSPPPPPKRKKNLPSRSFPARTTPKHVRAHALL